ncbi:MAG: hypothetical protein QMD46_04450 [Methanomicrobiales archaeon]|nr:hypothetical protein [Methanomicrobiales archaeon]MDI6876562.1 hypothetical protein [Methanomicrobiales archaeon]
MSGIPERIAIAGAGVSGAWLYRALTAQGRSVDIYEDGRKGTACGIHSCAWGVGHEFFPLVRSVGLEPETYVTNRIHTVIFGGRHLPADQLFLIDKPGLIEDLLSGAEIVHGRIPKNRYDRILDCSGAARACLPPTRDPDLICSTVQYRARIPAHPNDTIVFTFGPVGGAWLFPLGDGTSHLGSACLSDREEDAAAMLERSGIAAGDSVERICGCRSRLRISGPAGALPHTVPESEFGCPVWGVGESIGTVSPLSGEGITNALRCATLYLAHESDPHAYSSAVLEAFSWMVREREVLDKVMRGQMLWPRDMQVFRRNASRVGMRITVVDVLAILKRAFRNDWRAPLMRT